MSTLEGSALPTQTIAYLLLGLSVLALVIGVIWFISRQAAERERRAADALNAVMAATVLRRNLGETLGLILARMVETLQATSGALHLSDGSCLRLIHSVGVEQLDWLTSVPLDDPVAQHLTTDDVALVPLEQTSPWAALSPDGQPLTVIVGRLGWRAKRRGIVVLGWPGRSQAESNLGAVRSICQYAQQVLAEFEVIEEQAREFQMMTTELHRQEVLSRTAAHDIANQLAASLGYFSLLTNARDLSPEHKELAQKALQQLTLIQPLLDDLKSPDRAIELTRVPVERLIELLAGIMALRGDDPITFRLDVPADLPDVWCERVAIIRVFYNLLTNAIRHNPDCDALMVWVRARRAGQMVEFEVGDSGRGIGLQEQARLFEFGLRADSTGKVKGHGLGLWSCRRIIEAHGGRIWVESQPGEGARFYFTLTMAPLKSDGRTGATRTAREQHEVVA